MTDEVSLRDYLEQRFDHLDAKVEDLSKHLDALQLGHGKCRDRCDSERGRLWDALDDIRLCQAKANGRENAAMRAQERTDLSGYYFWVKVGAVAAVSSVGVALLFALFQFIGKHI